MPSRSGSDRTYANARIVTATVTFVAPPAGRCRAASASGDTANTTQTVRIVTWKGPTGNVGRARSAIGTGIGFISEGKRGRAPPSRTPPPSGTLEAPSAQPSGTADEVRDLGKTDSHTGRSPCLRQPGTLSKRASRRWYAFAGSSAADDRGDGRDDRADLAPDVAELAL